MGKRVAETVPDARRLYDRASQLLGYDLAELCFHGPSERLDMTAFSQPALYVTSLAALELLRRESAQVLAGCQAAAGLSLGEYTAMAFAGVIDFEAGLAIVRERGLAMQQAADAVPSGMVSILGLARDEVDKICHAARENGDILQVANLLCPGNIVASGSKQACVRLGQLALQAGAMKVVPLAVAGAFHTPLMQPAVGRLASILSQVRLSRPRIPVLTNADATYHDDPEEIRSLLVRQIVQPVLWEDSMRQLLRDDFNVFYEIGPGRVLRGLLRRIDRNVTCHTVMD
jgi:[acyl-carrier-protein] S-malonyltransferase